MSEQEARLREDIRKVLIDIHDNFSHDQAHYFDVLTEYIVGMLTLSAEITSRLVLKPQDGA